mmetsp:Transcript_19269/g.48198  ORF Transcript_19269/g.48198 Transcript_19269/m.48198 type:complete len:181 (+) Transcript_19269:1-543(+)
MPEIKRMFMELDADGSGEISKEEMVDGLESNPEMRIDLEHFLGALDPVQLFEVLNVDGEGQVSITEFCDHLCERVTSEAPIEMTKVLKIVQQCKSMMQKVMLNVTAIRDEMGGGSDAGNGRAEKGAAAGAGGGHPQHQQQEPASWAGEVASINQRIDRMTAVLEKLASVVLLPEEQEQAP